MRTLRYKACTSGYVMSSELGTGGGQIKFKDEPTSYSLVSLYKSQKILQFYFPSQKK
jgi:hypothetical protein